MEILTMDPQNRSQIRNRSLKSSFGLLWPTKANFGLNSTVSPRYRVPNITSLCMNYFTHFGMPEMDNCFIFEGFWILKREVWGPKMYFVSKIAILAGDQVLYYCYHHWPVRTSHLWSMYVQVLYNWITEFSNIRLRSNETSQFAILLLFEK